MVAGWGGVGGWQRGERPHLISVLQFRPGRLRLHTGRRSALSRINGPAAFTTKLCNTSIRSWTSRGSGICQVPSLPSRSLGSRLRCSPWRSCFQRTLIMPGRYAEACICPPVFFELLGLFAGPISCRDRTPANNRQAFTRYLGRHMSSGFEKCSEQFYWGREGLKS
jgi:hypothetical protein